MSEIEIVGEVVPYYYSKLNLQQCSEVFTWDLDKTYLDTRIDSLRGLLDAVLERSFSKKNIPATNILIKQLENRWQLKQGNLSFPLFFITASPPQMEERIREKLEYDGIHPMGCYYKNNLRNLQPSRWWRLNRHIGYKLSALLLLRSQLAQEVNQVLWGDDSESDAVIYNLYSDICSHRLDESSLILLFKKMGMAQDNVDLILQLRALIPKGDPVQKIYINLAIDTDHDYYLKFGRRTVATSNTLQVALDLWQDRRLEVDDVILVYDEMIKNYNYTHEELFKSFVEFARRPQLSASFVNQFVETLKDKGYLSNYYEVSFKTQTLEEINHPLNAESWVQDQIDYLNEYR